MVWTGLIFLRAHTPVKYCNCVKFHQYPFTCHAGVTRNMDRWTIGRIHRLIPIYPQNFVCGGYNEYQLSTRTMHYINNDSETPK